MFVLYVCIQMVDEILEILSARQSPINLFERSLTSTCEQRV